MTSSKTTKKLSIPFHICHLTIKINLKRILFNVKTVHFGAIGVRLNWVRWGFLRDIETPPFDVFVVIGIVRTTVGVGRFFRL